MAVTAPGIDARATLLGWLTGVTGMYTKDIQATPEDKWNATMGGVARPLSMITADAVALLDWTTAALQGQTRERGDLYEAAQSECATRDGAIASIGRAAEGFRRALSAATDEALNSEILPPWQKPTPLFMVATIAVSHLWYHDGQVNYVQALCGDEKVHWLGD